MCIEEVKRKSEKVDSTSKQDKTDTGKRSHSWLEYPPVFYNKMPHRLNPGPLSIASDMLV